MNETEYAAICAFVQKHSGIMLGNSKGYLIESRLTPIASEFGFADVAALARDLTLAKPELRDAVVDAMTTNESFFFRDTTPFAIFEKTILPALAKARGNAGRLRIWCAAASTGQEPYSIAMVLLSNKALWSGMKVEIIGTDLSKSALARAQNGKYSQFEVQRGLPVQLLLEHFGQVGTSWIISDEIKKMVRFQHFNQLDPMGGFGTMDVVFCRNVLIYFDLETKRKVLESIAKVMQPDGFLLLGAAETMMGVTNVYEGAENQRGLYVPVQSERRSLTA